MLDLHFINFLNDLVFAHKRYASDWHIFYLLPTRYGIESFKRLQGLEIHLVYHDCYKITDKKGITEVIYYTVDNDVVYISDINQ